MDYSHTNVTVPVIVCRGPRCADPRFLFHSSCFFLLPSFNRPSMSKRLAPDDTLELPLIFAPRKIKSRADFAEELKSFREFGKRTQLIETHANTFVGDRIEVPTYVNEFWTAKQRAAHSLHEISYRACFKPALPRFFIERLTEPGDVVYDPFMGRGTTLMEAALLGRVPAGCDANPLSA